MEVEHGLFNVSLGADKFFAYSRQSPLSLGLEEALAAFGQPVAHSERPRRPDESASDVLNVLGALSDGQHEPIGDQGADMQRSLQPC